MTYLRFQSLQPCHGTPSRLGIFQIAFQVRDAVETHAHDADEIDQNLRWLQMHLRSPNLSAADRRAIFWFKQTAREPMKRIWAMKPYLEAYGYWIELVKTWKPGLIIYEDGWQVAAKPWRDGR
jgi:hypothetical protein